MRNSNACNPSRLYLLSFLAILLSQTGLAQSEACIGLSDWLFTNGKIHTMDAQNRIVNSMRVINQNFVEVGSNNIEINQCTQEVNLQGRTVLPGLIDNHNHIVLLGLRPGHDTRLERAESIQAALDIVQIKVSELSAGEWITSIGGFDIRQFTAPDQTPRFPNLTELDSVTPNHPVYIQVSFNGPAVTNSLGKQFFENVGIEVGVDGSLAGGFQTPNPTTQALFQLNALQDMEDKKRGTLDALRYAASLGITTHLDQGGFVASGTDSDGAAHFNPYSSYDALLELQAENKLINRLRINFLHMEDDPETPLLAARLQNSFPNFGSDMLKSVGIGELTASSSAIIFNQSEAWLNGTRLVAEAGWRNENHSLTAGDFKVIIDGWEQINNEMDGTGIKELGWVLAHAPFIDEEYAIKLKNLGGGVSVLGGWRYISGTAEQNGPPFRTLLDSGIPIGMSSDGMQIAPMNPWIGLYYAITGRNVHGELINEGQTLTREEAIRLYTSANKWFLQEDEIGSIEVGNFADLTVLSGDYFDESSVSDDDVKDLHSVMTLVDGNIVFGSIDDLGN